MKDGKPTDYSKYSLRYPFSSKIVCGYCGAIFTRKMGRVKQDGTRTPYWACQRRTQEDMIVKILNLLEKVYYKKCL